jgi:ribosomal protein L11 methyltransferase
MGHINWEKQWEQFAENFHNGYAHIQLDKFGSPKPLLLKLAPGPGFGDLSHPTTALTLEHLMHQKNEDVLDIGCGSGILTLAAILAGAKSAIGVDICPDAIVHAKQNAQANGLQKKAQFYHKFPPKPLSGIILMNMIFSEQKEVMKEKERFALKGSRWITSGILAEQQESYLAWIESLGLQLLSSKEKDGWMGFVFS